MGCDGGTIPRRDELVRLKKKPETVCRIKNIHFFTIYLETSRKTRIPKEGSDGGTVR